jgi:CRP/FNR family cyclic AMP-dependent transcriptional regulator
MITHSSCAHHAHHADDADLLATIEGNEIALLARRIRLPRGMQLGLPGRHGSTLVLAAGRLSAETVTADGQETFVADVEPGDVIGEAFAFERCDTPFEVLVDEASDAWCFEARDFAAAFERHPAFAKAVVRAMCRRQCRTLQRMSEIMTLPMAGRLAAELLRLAACDPSGRAIVRLPTHRRLASRIATQREAVTKELSRLKRQGAIRKERHGLRLVGPSWNA